VSMLGRVWNRVNGNTRRAERERLAREAHELLLGMPLRQSLCSDRVNAPFFAGVGVNVMQGAFITADTQLGAYTYVGFNASVTRARIGRYVSIANRASIGPGEHALDRVSTNSIFYDSPYALLTAAPVVVEDDVWIGEAAIIRRGVTLGRGCVVGAMSFVNRDVPPYAVVAGVPARIIRMRFTLERIAQIEQSQWWQLAPKEAGEQCRKLDVQSGVDNREQE